MTFNNVGAIVSTHTIMTFNNVGAIVSTHTIMTFNNVGDNCYNTYYNDI